MTRPRRTLRTGAARRFLRDEGGAVTAFAFFIFLIMLMVGGLAVDTMHHEMVRARMQGTLDRAVLAGAKSHDAAEARATVEDYFEKADLAQYLDAEKDGDIEIHLNSARVSASASGTMDTYLLKLAGVDTLSTGGASTAEVRIPKLEISLVLDVSGSMRGAKITSLQTAAKQFVTTILDTSEDGNAVLSVIPFSWSVTPPQTVFDALPVNSSHNHSTCLRFEASDFQTTELIDGTSVDQMIYTSVFGDFDDHNESWRSCFNDDHMKFLPYSMDEDVLHAKIDSLEADGNTSGHEGMNWGAALLDPSFRQISAQLIANNEMDASLSHVPADYDEPETLKVVVMMGDGANTTSYFFDTAPSAYRGPDSDLYRVEHQEQESDPVISTYYLRDPNPERYYDLDEEEWLSPSEFDDLEDLDGFLQKERLSWEDAWGMMSPRFYRETTGDWGPWNDYVGSERLDGAAKDVRMEDVCEATKAGDEVVVYTIGFQVPIGGRAEQELSDCASSSSHYYRANTTDISAVFSSIADNVQNLRLTQ